MAATKWGELKTRLPAGVTILAVQHGPEATTWSTPCTGRLAITEGPGNWAKGKEVLASCTSPGCNTGFLRIQTRTCRGFAQYQADKPVRFVRGH